MDHFRFPWKRDLKREDNDRKYLHILSHLLLSLDSTRPVYYLSVRKEINAGRFKYLTSTESLHISVSSFQQRNNDSELFSRLHSFCLQSFVSRLHFPNSESCTCYKCAHFIFYIFTLQSVNEQLLFQ